MTRRPTSSREEPTTIPARWRIVGWIMLTTALVLLALGLTVRAQLLAEVDRNVNQDVVQEMDEFRTFVVEGVDPTTTEPFTDPERLLELYLSRQIPAPNEVQVGIVGGHVLSVDRSGPESPYDLAGDRELVDRIRHSASNSGVEESPAGPVRWGRVTVEGTDAQFITALFTAEQRDSVNSTMQVIAWGALGGLALTALFGYLVAGQILAPVREVRGVAERIQETDLHQRVPVKGKDDISQLAETFNAMLDRLEAAYDTQRQFVDDAGHELRTPITVIRGHLETMDDDPAHRAETMRLVDSELHRMSRIVSDLLIMAKSERPDFVRTRPVDAAEMLLDIEAQAEQLGSRRWELVEIAEGSAHVDPQRITQAALQLASNAVAHTSEGGRIQLGSRWSEGPGGRWLSLFVSDDGPGVTAADAERIFDRFDRGTTTASDSSGAGLGLSIVAAIARAHGGTVALDSEPGQGATFTVEVPAEAPAPQGGDDTDTDVLPRTTTEQERS